MRTFLSRWLWNLNRFSIQGGVRSIAMGEHNHIEVRQRFEISSRCRMSSILVCFQVDCIAHKDVCGKFDVSGYPTIKLFRNGEMSSDYDSGRTAGVFLLHFYHAANFRSTFSYIFHCRLIVQQTRLLVKPMRCGATPPLNFLRWGRKMKNTVNLDKKV